MSDKSVFGQCGPKNINNLYFLKRTICRKLGERVKIFFQKIQNTMKISNNYYSFLVKNFVFLNNPQITNSRMSKLSKFKIIYFFKLSMIVGISEAIRLLLTFYFYFLNYSRNIFLFSNILNLSFINGMFCLNLDKEQKDKKPSDTFNE